MSREPYSLTNIANRIRVCSPGIIAAVVLTVAAAGFLLAALLGAGKIKPIADVAPKQVQQHRSEPQRSDRPHSITPVVSHSSAH